MAQAMTITRLDQLLLERLKRYLRITVGLRKISVYYTAEQTSYYDGKALHVIKNVDREPHLHFNAAEAEMIRKAHAIHEAGHHFYDYLPDYIEWLNQNSLKMNENYMDFASHKRIPRSYLQMFGNSGLDGRMERLLCLNFPNTEVQALLEFCNEEWAFHPVFNEAIRGKSKVSDFREMYHRRVNGMNEFKDEWIQEVQELYDTHQAIMDKFLKATTTKKCLEGVSEWIEAVWPTVLEWIAEESDEPQDANDAYSENMFNENTEWAANPDLIEQMVEQLLSSQNANTPTEPKQEQIEAIKSQIQAGLDSVEAQIKQEEKEANGIPVSVSTHYKGQDTLANLIVKTPTDEDINIYNNAAQQSIRNVVKLSAVLKSILAEVAPATIRGTNRGRLMMNRVWQGVYCDNPNIRQYDKSGTPASSAIIEFMTDISGSTSGSVLRTIKESLSLFLLAADRAEIPTKAFAFNSRSTDTTIYNIKPHKDVFDSKVKGRIGGLKSGLANRDISALQYLFDDITKEDAHIKIAVMISDGAPNFYGDESKEMMTHMIEEIEKQGVHVLCLFVGNDEWGYEIAREIYGKRVIHAQQHLIETMRSSIINILKKAVKS